MSEHLKMAREWQERMDQDGVTIGRLRGMNWHLLAHLEAQQSQPDLAHRHRDIHGTRTSLAIWEPVEEETPQSGSAESSAITESHITARPWVALDDRIKAQTPLLQRLLGVLTDHELTAVDNSSKLQGRLDRFALRLWTLVRDVDGITSTYPSQASSPSVATREPAPSSGGSSSDPIPMLLNCLDCGSQHVDEGEWATRPHRTHRCLNCLNEWRPANIATVGVANLPESSSKEAEA